MLMTSETRPGAEVAVSELGRDLVLLTWSGGGRAAVSPEHAAQAYHALAEAVRERGCVPVQERVFGDLHAAGLVARSREQALRAAGTGWPVPPTYVEGSPLVGDGLAGIHVIAARGRARVVGEGEPLLGTVVETEDFRLLGLSDVGRRAAGRLAAGPAEEAETAIAAAEQLLGQEGFSFRDVARTWFYLRDILDWYGPFNAARNAAFRRMGLMGDRGDGKIPASTGIEGRNARGGWCALDLVALQSRGSRPAMRRLSNRKQNEATEYGSAFARAMEVVLGDARYIFVSGTASIDDRGATVHVGDFDAQTRFTLEAVQSLLEAAGASLEDVRQATAFLKNPADGRAFERIVAGCGLAGAPLVTTVADVCRDDLLFEIDATAVVPLRGASRR